MKFALLLLFFLSSRGLAEDAPFTLSVVPSSSGPKAQFVTISNDSPDEFYVVLRNVSKEPASVWETWNSWGYQTISFEIKTASGKTLVISKAPRGFDKNFPSTYLIPPGEHQVFPIKLDKTWEVEPSFSKNAETPVTIIARYDVARTKECGEFHVWAGHVESKAYHVTLRHW